MASNLNQLLLRLGSVFGAGAGGVRPQWQIIGSKARPRETKETSVSPLVMQPHLCNSVKGYTLMWERIIGLDGQTIPTWEQTI